LSKPCQASPGAEGIEELWAWSPTGARLALARVDGGSDNLFVIDPSDGSRRTVLRAGDGDLTALEWSPDGTEIAVAIGPHVELDVRQVLLLTLPRQMDELGVGADGDDLASHLREPVLLL